MNEQIVPVAVLFLDDGDYPICEVHDPALCKGPEAGEILPECDGCQVRQLLMWMRDHYRPALACKDPTKGGGGHAKKRR